MKNRKKHDQVSDKGTRDRKREGFSRRPKCSDLVASGSSYVSLLSCRSTVLLHCHSRHLVNSAQVILKGSPRGEMLLALCTVEIGIVLVDGGLWIDNGLSWRLYSVYHSQMVHVLGLVLHGLVAFCAVMIGIVNVNFCAGIHISLGQRNQLHTMCCCTM